MINMAMTTKNISRIPLKIPIKLGKMINADSEK
jgi:hypothetical protein